MITVEHHWVIFLLSFPNAKLRPSSHWETKPQSEEKQESIRKCISLRDEQLEQEQEDAKNEAKAIFKIAFGTVFPNYWLVGLSKLQEL